MTGAQEIRTGSNAGATKRSPVLLALLTAVVVFILLTLLLLAAEGATRLRQLVKHGDIQDMYFIDSETGLRLPKPGTETRSIRINSRSLWTPSGASATLPNFSKNVSGDMPTCPPTSP